MYYIFIINLYVDEHLGCFYFLVLMNIASINMDVYLCGRIWITLGIVPGVVYLGHMIDIVLTF